MKALSRLFILLFFSPGFAFSQGDEPRSLTISPQPQLLNISAISTQALQAAKSNQLLVMSSHARARLMLLFGHFQYGERSLIRHRAVEEDSMEDHSLHGTKDSFRQVLRGYAVNEGGSENLRITSSTRSQKFFGPGEVIQRIRIPVYSGESIEVALLKLETARRNSAG